MELGTPSNKSHISTPRKRFFVPVGLRQAGQSNVFSFSLPVAPRHITLSGQSKHRAACPSFILKSFEYASSEHAFSCSPSGMSPRIYGVESRDDTSMLGLLTFAVMCFLIQLTTVCKTGRPLTAFHDLRLDRSGKKLLDRDAWGRRCHQKKRQPQISSCITRGIEDDLS